MNFGSLYFILGNLWNSLGCKWYCDFIHLESPFLLETLGSIYGWNGKPGVYFKVIRAGRKWMGWKGNKIGSGAGNCWSWVSGVPACRWLILFYFACLKFSLKGKYYSVKCIKQSPTCKHCQYRTISHLACLLNPGPDFLNTNGDG